MQPMYNAVWTLAEYNNNPSRDGSTYPRIKMHHEN